MNLNYNMRHWSVKKKKINIIVNKNILKVKGPLGEVIYKIDKNILILNKNKIFVKRNKYLFFKNKIKTLQKSVVNGWLFQLKLEGKGFKIFLYKNFYCFDLGYSNLFLFKIRTEEIKLILLHKKLIAFGLNKEFLYKIANMLKNFYYKDKYHGKGLYLNY